MRRYFNRLGLWVALCFTLQACSPASPEEKAGDRAGSPLSYDFTLSQQEFDALSPDDQFMVANKVLSTMYRGIPADEFFDLTQGLENPVVQYNNFINDTQVKLQRDMSNNEVISANLAIEGREDNTETTDIDESIPALFTEFDRNGDAPHQHYIARALSYPISRDQFVQWMSVFLANTIMFSPAKEMESTDKHDVSRVLKYLTKSIGEGAGIRSVVRSWLGHISRWRVSRSPENHALEMFELYLGVFNDTPEEQQNTNNGGIACGEYYLTDGDDGYQLSSVDSHTGLAEPVKVFNQYIYDCNDLYDLVSAHPLLIPRVVEVISNYFLDGMTLSKKSDVVKSIVATNPETFEDVFLAVMYSKAFLLESERPKTFEENAFNFLSAMHWTPRCDYGANYNICGDVDTRVLNRVWNSREESQVAVHRMGWATMDYKIGRTPFLPLDVQSFATYHKALRESVLLKSKAYDGEYYPTVKSFTEDEDNPRQPPFEIVNGGFYVAGTENLKPELESLTGTEFIDFVFLSAMGRRATTEEMNAFLEEGQRRNYLSVNVDGVIAPTKTDSNKYWEYYSDDFAVIMLDYMSRLPEFYYYRAVQ